MTPLKARSESWSTGAGAGAEVVAVRADGDQLAPQRRVAAGSIATTFRAGAVGRRVRERRRSRRTVPGADQRLGHARGHVQEGGLHRRRAGRWRAARRPPPGPSRSDGPTASSVATAIPAAAGNRAVTRRAAHRAGGCAVGLRRHADHDQLAGGLRRPGARAGRCRRRRRRPPRRTPSIGRAPGPWSRGMKSTAGREVGAAGLDRPRRAPGSA